MYVILLKHMNQKKERKPITINKADLLGLNNKVLTIAYDYVPKETKSKLNEVYMLNLEAIKSENKIQDFIDSQLEENKIESATNEKHEELLERGHADA